MDSKYCNRTRAAHPCVLWLNPNPVQTTLLCFIQALGADKICKHCLLSFCKRFINSNSLCRSHRLQKTYWSMDFSHQLCPFPVPDTTVQLSFALLKPSADDKKNSHIKWVIAKKAWCCKWNLIWMAALCPRKLLCFWKQWDLYRHRREGKPAGKHRWWDWLFKDNDAKKNKVKFNWCSSLTERSVAHTASAEGQDQRGWR